ncbi:MAG: adenylate/guanylate cyclase domain-containing protein [Candidatus Limnocylindria bacterium]
MSACPSCSRDVPEGFAFCPHCGASLVSESSSREERKLVTLLFADVTGSTRLAEQLDAEIVRDLMVAYFALAREEIEARGGTVEKFIGDAVMAVFGVPVAHEDDPARALRAALAIRSRLAELNARHRDEGRPELQVRIGVNSGDVVSTTSPRPGEVMVTGDAVNVAARMQQMAAPGQILVGHRTASAADQFDFRSLGRREMRGKAVDVDVSELVGERSGPAEAGSAILRAPLIGRDEELALLTSIYDRVAADGRPHLLTLYGQPGVGKSRLTFEFLASLRARESPPRVVRGRCLSYGTGVTFWPLAEILKSQAGIMDSDAPMAAMTKLSDLGAGLISKRLAPDPQRTTALLGFTVGIAVPGHDFSRMDPEQLRGELVEAWRTFFSALAEAGPVIAVVEDIHWADTALLDILDDLGARVQGAVLFLCPARPDLTDRRPGWGGGRRSFSGVFLDPLDPDDASRLVAQLLTIEELPTDLHARIVERAGGNPFFVEEILRHLIDQGRIQRMGDGWRAEAGLTTVAIPDTVQAVLAARIDLLAPDEKRALQAAAVVGRVFWPAPIGRYLESTPARTAELLRGLESRDLVLSRLGSTMAGEPEHIFKHALVRDVAYESIPKRDRAMAHLEVARWIEETIGERRLEVVELLAHHYTAAQRAAPWGRVEPDRREEIRSRAVDLLFEAAEEAARLFAFDRARERLETGLELAIGPLERARGLEAQARLLLWQDDGDGAWTSAREAVDLRVTMEGGYGNRRAISRLCGLLLAIPTRWPGMMRDLPRRADAEPYLDLGFSMLSEGDSEERLGLLMARAFWGWGFSETDTDPTREAAYIAASDEAIALARRLGRPDLISAALDAAGAAVGERGGYGAQQRFQEERMRLVPELDDPGEVADIYGTLAWMLVHVGDYRRAVDMPQRTYVGRSGLTALPVVSNRSKSVFQAVGHFRLASWDRFWEIFHELDASVVPGRPIPYHSMRMYGIAAYLREIAGDADAADELIGRVDHSQASRASVGVSGARLWIVQTLVRRQRFTDARARLAEADPARESQNRDLSLEAWADVIAAEGTWSEAAGVVTEARAWAAKTKLLALPAFADRLDGQASLAAGDSDRGFALLERARETLSGLGAAWERARTELTLAEALVAAGRAADAAKLADAALTTFALLPAPVEIERARSLSNAEGGSS